MNRKPQKGAWFPWGSVKINKQSHNSTFSNWMLGLIVNKKNFRESNMTVVYRNLLELWRVFYCSKYLRFLKRSNQNLNPPIFIWSDRAPLPPVFKRKIPENLGVYKGEPLKINCVTEGYPLPQVGRHTDTHTYRLTDKKIENW